MRSKAKILVILACILMLSLILIYKLLEVSYKNGEAYMREYAKEIKDISIKNKQNGLNNDLYLFQLDENEIIRFKGYEITLLNILHVINIVIAVYDNNKINMILLDKIVGSIQQNDILIYELYGKTDKNKLEKGFKLPLRCLAYELFAEIDIGCLDKFHKFINHKIKALYEKHTMQTTIFMIFKHKLFSLTYIQCQIVQVDKYDLTELILTLECLDKNINVMGFINYIQKITLSNVNEVTEHIY